ncbi:hypothetical protein D3C77_328240 [compost metagenome]
MVPGAPILDTGIDRAVGKGFALASEAQQVGNEEGLHMPPIVLLTAHKVSGTVLPTDTGASGAFHFTHHQRDAVYIQHDIEEHFSSRYIVHLLGHHEVVVVEVVEVDQIDGDVLAVLSKGQGFFSQQPCLEIFVGPDQATVRGLQQYTAQLVDDLICVIWLFVDSRV